MSQRLQLELPQLAKGNEIIPRVCSHVISLMQQINNSSQKKLNKQ